MFIVLEGLDGAGKSTQIALLRQWLSERGVASEYLHFPRFDAPVYGDLIARFLRGEFGGVETVNPYLVALIYAGDRADAASQLRKWLDEGKAMTAVICMELAIFTRIRCRSSSGCARFISLRHRRIRHCGSWIAARRNRR